MKYRSTAIYRRTAGSHRNDIKGLESEIVSLLAEITGSAEGKQ